MTKKISFIILVFLMNIYTCTSLWAYDGEVHYKLNEEATRYSQLDGMLKNQLYIQNGVDATFKKGRKEKSIVKWIAYGGEAEDFGRYGAWDIPRSRAFNHFHDPLKAWNEAGLDDPFNSLYIANYRRPPVSPIVWGLNPEQQDFERNATGDWSWGKAREHYYTYLTGKGKDLAGNTVTVTQGEREAAFADCFRAVGQVMHLLEDMSVPLHTRNDVHVFPWKVLSKFIGRWTYETFTKENIDTGRLDYNPNQPGDWPHPDLLTDPQPESGYNDLAPVSGLFDHNVYNQGNPIPASNAIIGMAEYSNANFLTNDTMWKYPHPAVEDTNYDPAAWPNPETIVAEDGQHDQRIYFRKDVGDPIEHFMVAQYWYIHISPTQRLNYYTLGVDRVCFADYADKLIPRAVGYSAALLDYFFRGNFDISFAETKLNNEGKITGIDIEVKNKSTIGNQSTLEPFENGHIALACQYTPAGQNQQPVYTLILDNTGSGVIYTINGAGDPINSDYVSISVSFAEESYIPDGATDVSFTIAFRGKLGHEENAVAAKTFPMNTSRIAYSYRPDGWPEPSHIYTLRPDGTDKWQRTQVVIHTDPPKNEEYFFAPTWSPDGTKLAFENSHEVGCAGSRCAREIVIIDSTSEMTYPHNVVQRLTFYDLREDDEGNPYTITALLHPSFSPDGRKIVAKVYATQFIFPLVIYDLNSGDWNYINDFEFWEQKQPQGGSDNFSSIAWSPQGDKIAYTVAEYHEETIHHDAFTDFDIYTINPDGTGDTPLTNDIFMNGDPSWSPDGEQIVFASNRGDGGDYLDIWVMDKDGQNESWVFDCFNYNCNGPSFSPDGEWIVFSHGETIHKVKVDGTGIAFLEAYASNPSWCPVPTLYDPLY